MNIVFLRPSYLVVMAPALQENSSAALSLMPGGDSSSAAEAGTGTRITHFKPEPLPPVSDKSPRVVIARVLHRHQGALDKLGAL